MQVRLGLLPALGQVVERDGLAGRVLVLAQVRFDRVEKGRQIVLVIVEVRPVVGPVRSFVGQRLGIVVAIGVAQLAQLVGAGRLVARARAGRGLGRGVRVARVLFLHELGAQLVRLRLGRRGDRGLQGPLALRRPARQAVESEGVGGIGAKIDDLPLVLAELVEVAFQHRGGGEASLAAGDHFVFPKGHIL